MCTYMQIPFMHIGCLDGTLFNIIVGPQTYFNENFMTRAHILHILCIRVYVRIHAANRYFTPLQCGVFVTRSPTRFRLVIRKLGDDRRVSVFYDQSFRVSYIVKVIVRICRCIT